MRPTPHRDLFAKLVKLWRTASSTTGGAQSAKAALLFHARHETWACSRPKPANKGFMPRALIVDFHYRVTQSQCACSWQLHSQDELMGTGPCMTFPHAPPPYRDNLRGFFDKCFPNLLKRIFGYDDFEASWLNIVAKVRDYPSHSSTAGHAAGAGGSHSMERCDSTHDGA